MTSCDLETLRSWHRYIWGLISRQQYKLQQWDRYRIPQNVLLFTNCSVSLQLAPNNSALERDGKQSYCSSMASLPVRPHCTNARQVRCQADLNSFPLGELEETTGMPPYYVDEDYPTGPGIT